MKTRKEQFEKLLSPLQIKDVKLKNRIWKPGAVMLYGDVEGYVTEMMKDFYESIAKGGAGMIVLEMAVPDYPLGFDGFGDMPGMLRIDDDKFIPKLSELVQVVHKHDCPIIGQVAHGGPRHPAKETGLQPISASDLSYNETIELDLDAVEELPIRGLSIPEIEKIIDQFVEGAERFQKAGIDGVEIHAAHFYLLNSFLSRAYNKRNDKYGCQSIENRARILVEIIKESKARLGKDFLIGVRINGIELGIDKGLTSEETRDISILLEKAGTDYISVSGWGFGSFAWLMQPDQMIYPEPTKAMKPYVKQIKRPGLLIPPAEAIKKVVSVPVVGVGRLDHLLGEWLLRKGKVDLVAINRYLIANPELPNKLASGKLEDIRPCLACLQCEDRWKPRRCRMNPAAGHERELAIKPAEKKKKVMVVGGGPAGLEAAMVAKLRGHEVLLYDKEPRLGGLLPLATLVKGNEVEDIPAIIRYYRTQLNKLGVKVILGKEITPELVDEIKPHVLVLSPGGKFTTPEIPGINRREVITSADLHRRSKTLMRFLGPRILRWLTKFYLPVGKKVVIMGGSMYGCEIAEFLIKRGRKVSIVETYDKLATGLPLLPTSRLISWLVKKGTMMLTGVKYEKITEEGLVIITKEGLIRVLEADTILVVLPLEPNMELFKAFEGKVPEIYLIGDARKEGKVGDTIIANAIADGRRVGCAI